MIFNFTQWSEGAVGPTAADAILLVTAPALSVVTMTKGTDTRVPTMWVSASNPSWETALFVIEAADFDASTAWTVTATLGAETASETVTIDSAKQYSLNLYYRVYLYNRGDKCESGIGGGWTIETYNTSRITWASDHLQYYVPGTNYATNIHTANKIDLSQFTTLHAAIGTNIACVLGICTNANRTNPGLIKQLSIASNNRVETEYVLDISDVSVTQYACIVVSVAGSSTSYVDMYAMWLGK